MTILGRIVNSFRRNTNPSPVLDETLYSHGLAYVDPLVFRGYNNFLNKIDKRASMYSDPIINTLTMGWANVATTKTFKFYSSHEIDAVEIMGEWRAWWIQNNLDELLMALIPHFCMDGNVLIDPYLREDKAINYEVYGSFECEPIHWKRDIENNIIQYNVKFVPFPSPTGWAWGGSSLRSVSRIYKGGELLHFTRGDWNYGLGKSRIAPIWDSVIKLRHGSYADFFRRDMRFILAVPEGWNKGRIDSFAASFNDMMKGTRRMFVYKMEQSEGPEKTPLELPRFGMESLARPAPKPMSQSEAGGELLRDPEWARLLAGTQLTENYFIGNQAGAVTGSEVDLTRDFYTECTEFGLLEPMIKGLINWFVMAGLVPEPPSDYVVKYWKDWEHIEKAAQLMEQEMSKLEGQQSTDQTRQELRQQSAPYILVNQDIDESIVGYRTNVNIPMTPIGGRQVTDAGVMGSDLLVRFKDYPGAKQGFAGGGTYVYHMDTEGEAQAAYTGIGVGGSSYVWSKLRGKTVGPAYLTGNPTPGGTSASLVDYDIWLGKAPGIVGTGPFAPEAEEAKPAQKPISTTQIPSYVPFQETTFDAPMSTAAGESQYTSGRVHDPSSITGHKKVGPGAKRKRGKSSSRPAIIPYNPSISLKNMAPKLNSQAYIKRMAREMGWGGISNSTAQKIMTLVKLHEVNNLPRYNSIVMGNVMDFDILLRYPDAPNGEKACKKEWKKINAHEGDLYIYEDLGHGGKRFNVGKYKYWWDDKEGKNVVKYNKEEVFEEIEKLLNSWGVTNSEIQLKINEGSAPDLSTEYYAGSVEVDGVVYQTNFHNSRGEPVFEGIAIVERGNCTFPACVYNIIYEEVIT